MYQVHVNAFHGGHVKSEHKTLEAAVMHSHTCVPCQCGGDYITGPDGNVVILSELPMDLLGRAAMRAEARSYAINKTKRRKV